MLSLTSHTELFALVTPSCRLRPSMSGPVRLEFPGAWWHVTNRGVEQRDIVLGDRDRRTFVRMLADAVPRFRWCVHAFVLMTTHSSNSASMSTHVRSNIRARNGSR